MRILQLSIPGLALLVACGGPDAPVPTIAESAPGSVPPVVSVPEPEAPKTMKERLEAGVELSLRTEGSGFTLSVSDDGQAPTETKPLEIEAGHAHLSLTSEGTLSLSGLEIALADIVVAAEIFPPSGLHFVDVRARLDLVALETAMSEDATLARFTGEAQLSVTWALLDREGRRVPLRPLSVQTELGGTLKGSAEGPVELEVLGIAPGSLLLVADRFGLSDASFSLDLVE